MAAAMQKPQFAAHTWYLITSPAEVGMEEVPNTASYRRFLLIQRGKVLWSKNIQTPCSAEISATEGALES